MNLQCDRCKKFFTATKEQDEFIADAQKKGMSFIMIRCPHCATSYPLNPQSMELPLTDMEENSVDFRCPKKTCCGVISHIDDHPPFWGCGECGSVWFDINELYKDIELILEKFPYRAIAYRLENNKYYPALTQPSVREYEDMIQNEWDNT